jgi:hypothetical protein
MMTIHRGQYSNKERALIVQGKLFRHEDGKVYHAETVRACYNDAFGCWYSEIEARRVQRRGVLVLPIELTAWTPGSPPR